MAGLQLRPLDKDVLDDRSNLEALFLSLLLLLQKLLYVNLAGFLVGLEMVRSIAQSWFVNLFVAVLTVLLLRMDSLATCKPLILHQCPVHARSILYLSLEVRHFWRHLYQID